MSARARGGFRLGWMAEKHWERDERRDQSAWQRRSRLRFGGPDAAGCAAHEARRLTIKQALMAIVRGAQFGSARDLARHAITVSQQQAWAMCAGALTFESPRETGDRGAEVLRELAAAAAAASWLEGEAGVKTSAASAASAALAASALAFFSLATAVDNSVMDISAK
eukprot:594723-Pleurochrysis_carterae.AAC.1